MVLVLIDKHCGIMPSMKEKASLGERFVQRFPRAGSVFTKTEQDVDIPNNGVTETKSVKRYLLFGKRVMVGATVGRLEDLPKEKGSH
jgi:hypothetical protein